MKTICVAYKGGKCVKWKVPGEPGASVSFAGLRGGRDVTKNFVRHRQVSPKACAVGSFRMITRGKTKLVICCPKGQWSRRSKRCRVGTMAQSILKPR